MSLKTYGMIAVVLVAAFAIAYLITPLTIRLAHRIGWMDVPRDKRRMHHKPIPLLGGLSIIAGFVGATLFILLLMSRYHYYDYRIGSLFLQIIPGALIIAVMAFLDDRYNLSPFLRLGIQCVAAGIAVGFGARISFISGSVRLFGEQTFNIGWLSIPITILWIAGMTNAMNWIDGLDGLADGIASIASITIMFLAILQGRPQIGVSILTAALAGSCLGLFPYNKNPARTFMGDTGAMFLGYVLGIITIQGLFKFYAVISFFVPVLILALPILDTASAILRRIFEGKSPFTADRSHIHHKLIDMGLSQRQAVRFLYTLSISLSVIAILFTLFGTVVGWRFLLLSLLLVLIVSLIFLKRCRDKSTRTSHDEHKEDTPALPSTKEESDTSTDASDSTTQENNPHSDK